VSICGVSTVVIGDQMPMDDVGQVALECASSLLGSLGVGQFALVVGLAGARVADLADRDDVQGGVELAVAGPIEGVRDARLNTCV
jgi:hypothetical protein